jgi:hypothetical protein
MEIKEQLGYLTALVETLAKDLAEHKEESTTFRNDQATRLKNIEDELSMYKTVYKTIKFIGMALIAIVTFKWTLVIDLWAHFKG